MIEFGLAVLLIPFANPRFASHSCRKRGARGPGRRPRYRRHRLWHGQCDIAAIAFGMVNATATDPGLAVLALGLLAFVGIFALGKYRQHLRERKQDHEARLVGGPP